MTHGPDPNHWPSAAPVSAPRIVPVTRMSGSRHAFVGETSMTITAAISAGTAWPRCSDLATATDAPAATPARTENPSELIRLGVVIAASHTMGSHATPSTSRPDARRIAHASPSLPSAASLARRRHEPSDARGRFPHDDDHPMFAPVTRQRYRVRIDRDPIQRGGRNASIPPIRIPHFDPVAAAAVGPEDAE